MADEQCRWCGATLYRALASDRVWQCGRCSGPTFNPRFLSFHGTKQKPQTTLGDIMALFQKFGSLVGGYQFANDPDGGRAGIEFIVRMRYMETVIRTEAEITAEMRRLSVPLEEVPATKEVWREGGLKVRFLLPMPIGGCQVYAQRWRLVLNWLENTLEAIAVGALRAEDAFLSFAVLQLPDGSEAVFGDHVRERLPQGEVSLPMLREPTVFTLRALPAPGETAGE